MNLELDAPTNPISELFAAYSDATLTFDQLQNVAEPRWLIDSFLKAESLAVIWGDPATGKSFVALDWAMSVATGTNWFGKATEPGSVLYVLGEGLSGMKMRANAWVQHHGVRPEGERLLFLKKPVHFLENFATEIVTQLTDEQTIAAGNDVKLIIIDTLARSVVGHSENDSTDMGKLVAVAEEIREQTKATVLFVHHSNRSANKSMRGSSALKGGIDTEIEMIFDEDSGDRALQCRKQKDGAPFTPQGVYLKPVAESLVPIPVPLTNI